MFFKHFFIGLNLLFIIIFAFYRSELLLLPVFYGINFCVIFFIGLKRYPGFKAFILSPHFIFLSYVLINYSLGSLLLYNGVSFKSEQVKWFESTNNHFAIFLYNSLALIIIFLLYHEKNVDLGEKLRWKVRLRLLPTIAILVFFSYVSIDASIFGGGGGDLSIIPRYFAVILLVAFLCTNRIKFRLVYYLVIIVFFASTNFESKREAIVILFFIAIFEREFIGRLLKKPFKFVVSAGLLGICFFLLVVSMSITRGYGGYTIEKYTDSFKYVSAYSTNRENLVYLAANFELTSSYYDSNKPIDFIINDPDLASWGANYLKVLFLPIPRSVFPDKPQSAMLEFTKLEDYKFFAIGGSLPINPIGESFWAFHFGGLLIIFFIFYVLNIFYYKLIRSLSDHNMVPKRMFTLVFIYGMLFIFLRGSGIELLVIYLLFFLAFLYIFYPLCRVSVLGKLASVKI